MSAPSTPRAPGIPRPGTLPGTLVAGTLLAVALLAGCATGGSPSPRTGSGAAPPDSAGSSAPSAPSSPSISTLPPMPASDDDPPDGRLVADLRQSSRDAALGRFQVWVGNGLGAELTPIRVRYRDPRFRRPVSGERLRTIPSGTARGFPLALPPRPRCLGPGGQGGLRPGAAPGVVEVRSTREVSGSAVRRVHVEDEADVVQRYVAARCFQLDLDRVATLSFADRLRPTGDDAAELLLRVTPRGRPGRRVQVDTVSGTPVLTPPGQPVWEPAASVAGDGEPLVLALPVGPARCDAHAFAESGGATAFRVALRLDGEPGEVLVRMGPEGAAAALAFAQEVCGSSPD
ncbi:hypothetical protein [Nocardioides campestrisoli]|uniref:hypothetical protein n=1 Tax=Nocardioides campestrisoli TaxID=2736757 RepID=UPI00163D5BBB|nr:hypothetical protein [Nocardioides campestrisoli]